MKIGEHIHLDIPKKTFFDFEENNIGNTATIMVNKAIVTHTQKIDAEIIKQIQEMAKEQGIDDIFLLDKTNIISALEKQIPKKPNIHGYREGREINTISYTCPACNKHIGRDAFCKNCGTALDWSDTE